MAEFGGIYEWYYSTFLNEYSGPDLNNLWIVSITPQEGEEKFKDAIKMEAARFDVDGNAVDKFGIVDGWDGKTLASMVDATWKANTATLPETLNIDGWGSNNVLIGVNNVMIPNDALNTKNAEMGPGYTWVPPMMADTHQPFQPLQLSFYYTAYPFSEFIVRPWTMAVNRYGLKLRCLRAHLTCTLFSRRNLVVAGTNNWIPKFQYIFYSCYPCGTPNVTLDYNDDAQDKTSQISFGYDFYRMRIPASKYPTIRYASEDFVRDKQFANYISRNSVITAGDGISSDEPKYSTQNGEMKKLGSFLEGLSGIDTPNSFDSTVIGVRGAEGSDVNADEGMFESQDPLPVQYYEPIYGGGPDGGLLGSILRRVANAVVGLTLGAFDTPLFMFSRFLIPVVPDEPRRVRSKHIGVGGRDDIGRFKFRGVNVPLSDEASLQKTKGMVVNSEDDIHSVSDVWMDVSEWDEVLDVGFFGIDEMVPDEPYMIFSSFFEMVPDEPGAIHSKFSGVDTDEIDSVSIDRGSIKGDEVSEVVADAVSVNEDEVASVNFGFTAADALDEPAMATNGDASVLHDEPEFRVKHSTSVRDDEVGGVKDRGFRIRDDEVKKIKDRAGRVAKDDVDGVETQFRGVPVDEAKDVDSVDAAIVGGLVGEPSFVELNPDFRDYPLLGENKVS